MHRRTAGRRALILIGVSMLAWLIAMPFWRFWLDRYGAGWTHDPEDAAWVLSPAAHQLVDRTFDAADDRS